MQSRNALRAPIVAVVLAICAVGAGATQANAACAKADAVSAHRNSDASRPWSSASEMWAGAEPGPSGERTAARRWVPDRTPASAGPASGKRWGCVGFVARCFSGKQAHAQMTRQLYLFQYSPGPTWRAGVPMREQELGPHAAYMQRLMDEGRLFAGGGYVDTDGGMAVVVAASMEEARAMLDADPAVTSGIFVAEVRHWRPRFRTDDPLPAAR